MRRLAAITLSLTACSAPPRAPLGGGYELTVARDGSHYIERVAAPGADPWRLGPVSHVACNEKYVVAQMEGSGDAFIMDVVTHTVSVTADFRLYVDQSDDFRSLRLQPAAEALRRWGGEKPCSGVTG